MIVPNTSSTIGMMEGGGGIGVTSMAVVELAIDAVMEKSCDNTIGS